MAGPRVVIRRRTPWLAAPAAFLVVFLVVPVTRVISSHLRFTAVVDILTDASMLRIIWFSLWQASLSVGATLIFGLPATWALSRFSFPGRSLARGLLTAPFVMPAVVIAAGVLAVLPVGHNHGVVPIIWAHVIFNIAVVIRVVSPRWSMLDGRLEEASAVLGARPSVTFIRVVWPQISGAIVSASTLVFIYCFTSFGVVTILGGFARRTMESEIFVQSVRLGDIRTATALAFIQALIIVVVAFVARRDGDAHHASGAPREPIALRDRPGARWNIVALLLGPIILVAAPLAAVIVRSLRLRGGFTMAGWRALGTRALPGMAESAVHVIGTSVGFSLSCALICITLGLIAATRGKRVMTALSTSPLIISSATLGIGLIVTFNRDPFAWRSQSWLIPVIHAVIAFPLVVRTIAPAHRAIPHRLREAASLLGAGPFRIWWWVDLPLLGPALMRATGLAMAVSLGEFGATSFLSRSGSTTLPIAIGRLLGRPGDITHLSGYALASLMVITTIGVMSRA